MTIKIASIENRYWLDHNLKYVPSWSTPGNARRAAYKLGLDHRFFAVVRIPSRFCYHYTLGRITADAKLALLNSEKELNFYKCEVC